MSVDLTGAADLHCHFGPDPRRERSVDAFEAAREAAAAHHRAVVLKSHDSPTASLAWAVQRDVGAGIAVYGGICCDREVGGVNPAAVEVALDLGARIVWLPTLSSRQDFENGIADMLGIPGPGIVVTDPDGALLPETREVLALVREHDAVLATGHVSAAEHYAVVADFARRGKVLLTHATEDLAGPKLTAAQCRELAELGAWVELCAMTCVGALATKSVGEMVATIKQVGVEHVTLGTDFGQKVNPHPAEGLQTYADALYAEGLTEDDIRQMACTNPCALLAIEEQPLPYIDIPDGKADPEVRVWALRPEMGMGAGALSHAIYEQSILPVRERELARMRIAFINGCAICQQWRKAPGAEGTVSEDEYARVLDWRGYNGFSARERLVIEYAELFALDHHAIDDAFFRRLRAAFSDAEILDLTVCIGGWLALGRTLHVLGLDDQCALAP